jgi:hypothetical protein
MKGRKMHIGQPQNHNSNPLMDIPDSGIVAYNLREEERPGGMKVRYKIKIVTGPKARELDEQQAEVIWELLRWARQYRAGQERGKI